MTVLDGNISVEDAVGVVAAVEVEAVVDSGSGDYFA